MADRCYICSRKLIDMNHETGKDICYNCDGVTKKEKTNAKPRNNKRNKSS